jgi:hypothetical protein
MTMTDTKTAAPKVGTPVYQRNYGKTGVIAEVQENHGAALYSIGAGGMQAESHTLTVVWEDLTMVEVLQGIAAPWIDAAAALGLATVENTADMLRDAKARQADERAKRTREAEEAAARKAAWLAEIGPKIPANAKAVLVAEYVSDRSDSMSDYYGSTTTRAIVLGFSTHKRDLFPEMRKAARNHAETAFLADAPESAEHREKWSMGGGYYLKEGSRHGDGWRVSKRPFYSENPASSIPAFAEWAVDAPKANPAPVAEAATGGAFDLQEHTHTKKGFQMWLAVPSERVAREIWEAQNEAAKALGGWWSRQWGKTPGGFAFRDLETARAFLAGQAGTTPQAEAGDTPQAAPAAPAGIADKLRGFADGLQGAIDNGRADRLTNTPKRQRQAAGARQQADNLQRAQTALRALADLHDAGEVPPELADLRTKAAALELAREKIDHSNSGYYDAGRQTGQPATDTPAARAFWALAKPKSAEEKRADEERAARDKISRQKIAGFFPTPAAVADELARYLGVRDGDKVLEPNAGTGALWDAVLRRAPGAQVVAYEINGTLREFLATQGRTLAGWDFMEAEPVAEFDSVIMNPPFENGQDMDHIRRAFDFLKPGGRMAAILAPGYAFKQDRRATSFREWLETLEHFTADLPAGTFKESGTGVSAVVLYIEKAE